MYKIMFCEMFYNMLENVKVDSSAIFSFALKVMKLQVVVYGINHNRNKMFFQIKWYVHLKINI